jgi:Tat protein secretion system quality control protein TatD with DNase activity
MRRSSPGPTRWHARTCFRQRIADKIAEIHKTTREQVSKITAANAERLFGWGG